MKRDRLRALLVFGVGALTAAIAAWGYGWFVGNLQHNYEAPRIIAAELLQKLVLPILGGLLALRLDGRPRSATPTGLRRRLLTALVWVIAFGYFITWAFGVPNIVTVLTAEEIAAYKSLEARNHDPSWRAFPTIKTSLAVPIAPGLIVVYHEAQIAGLNGWGGWAFYAWWGTGSRRLGIAMRWIS